MKKQGFFNIEYKHCDPFRSLCQHKKYVLLICYQFNDMTGSAKQVKISSRIQT